MSEPSAAASPVEAVLAGLVADLEGAADPAHVLEDYCARHPDLAARLREQANLIGALDQLRGTSLKGVPATISPGRLGDFRIVRRLRVGGMGEIYEAVQEPLGRQVAVKVIRRDLFSPQLRARFLREQQVLASLHQTHIVPIHAAGTEGALQFFAMPFIQGASLFHVIEFLKPGSAETGGAGETPSLAEVAGLLSTHPPGPTTPPQGEVSEKSAVACHAHALRGHGTQPRRTFSRAYLRSVAQFLIDAAEALQHAHDLGILHRDVKPSNLMVDSSGHCWIIDFGLAAYLQGPKEATGGAAATPPDAEPLTGQGLAGTPEYMAPEQWRGEPVDGRTDVWGLGVTLYELLTLRRAFSGATPADVRGNVLDRQPPPPERWVRRLPADLAAICRKALQKAPAHRFASARAFAVDLKHWLNGEPTTARPGWVIRRVFLWARRNKGWAVFLGGMLLAFAGLAVAGWAVEKSKRDLAEADAATAKAQERERQRETLMVELQLVRLRQRQAGWSEQAWELVRKAAELRTDSVLRDQAAATLSGLDSSEVKRFEGDSWSVLFDPTGKRLLMGGADDFEGQPKGPARLWDADNQALTKAVQAGAGSVAFGADGSALHLTVSAKDRRVLELWDLLRKERLREFRLPAGDNETVAGVKMALTPDGALLAASARLASGKSILAIWDATAGKLLRQLLDIEHEITALAVHPQFGFVATGGARGHLVLYPLKDGPAVPLPAPGPAAIHCLALHPAAGPRDAGGDGQGPWLLAVGEAGGRLAVWDLRYKVPRTFCHGSAHHVFAVSFSPNGATLVSGGRYWTKFWDVATGRLLLDASDHDYTTGFAFSPDNGLLAVSSRIAFGSEGRVVIRELQHGRGIRTFRGLVAPAARLQISSKGKYLAALSDDWQVAVWDLQSGRLVYLWDGPRGVTADNAALAFSRDETRLAISTYKEVRVWDLVTGKTSRAWPLPPGFQDALAFDAIGQKLLSCRMETADGMHPSIAKDYLRAHPLVVRIRDLLAADPKKVVLASVPDFNRRIHHIMAGNEGGPFAVTGELQGPSRVETHIKVFDGATGRELWSMPADGSAKVLLDPLGQILFVPGDKKLVAALTGKILATWDGPPGDLPGSGVGPEGHLGAIFEPHHLGFVLNRRADGKTVAVLGVDRVASGLPAFSEDGRLFAWGNSDGTVLVADLAEVQRRLARVGMGW